MRQRSRPAFDFMKLWHVLPCHRWLIMSRALLTQRPFPPRPILALVVVLFRLVCGIVRNSI
jgi:hypothetical protein